MLEGTSDTSCILDDMIITGRDDEEHLANLEEVLRQLQHHGLRANKAKCEFFKEKITYCGHYIDSNGLHKSAEKVEAVLKAPRPNDVAEVRSFHRHVTDKFSKDLSTRVIYKINCKDCDKVYISQTSRALRSRTREHKRAICTKDRNSLLTQHCIKSIMILTLTMSRSLTTVPNGQKDYF